MPYMGIMINFNTDILFPQAKIKHHKLKWAKLKTKHDFIYLFLDWHR